MGVATHFVTAITTAVMALVPASCSKLSSKAGPGAGAKTTAVATSNTTTNAFDPDSKVRDFGELSMTNNHELMVTVNRKTTCLIVPKILDKKSVQLTLSVTTLNSSGRVEGVDMTQMTGTMGQSMDVALGNVDITMTPMVVGD